MRSSARCCLRMRDGSGEGFSSRTLRPKGLGSLLPAIAKNRLLYAKLLKSGLLFTRCVIQLKGLLALLTKVRLKIIFVNYRCYQELVSPPNFISSCCYLLALPILRNIGRLRQTSYLKGGAS